MRNTTISRSRRRVRSLRFIRAATVGVTAALATSGAGAGTIYIDNGVATAGQANPTINGQTYLNNSGGIVINGSGGQGGYPSISGPQNSLPDSILYIGDFGTNNFVTGPSDYFGTTPITLNGGTLAYHSTSNGTDDPSTTVENLNVATYGVISSQPQFGGGNLHITNLTVNPTATVTFESQWAPIGNTGSDDIGKVWIDTSINGTDPNTLVANNNGILGGWATTRSFNNGGTGITDFATYGTAGVTAVTYSTAANVMLAKLTDNYNSPGKMPAGGPGTDEVTGNLTINSLNTSDSAGYGDFLVDSGALLTLNSGGFIMGGAGHWVLGGGTITAGLGGNYNLYATTNDGPDNQLHNVNIVDSPGTGGGASNPVTLIKGGIGTLILAPTGGTEGYTGNTIVNGGILRLDAGNQNGTLTPNTSVIVNSGATLLSNAQDSLGYGTGAVNVTLNAGILNVTNNNRVTIANTLTMNGGYIESAGNGNVDGTGKVTTGNYTFPQQVNAVPTVDGLPAAIVAATISIQNAGPVFNVANVASTPGAIAAPYGLVVSSNLVNWTAQSPPITKTGPGVLLLSGNANSYTGPTIISQGTLRIGAESAVAAYNFNSVNGSVVPNSGSLGPVANGFLTGSNATIVPGGGPKAGMSALSLNGDGNSYVDVPLGLANLNGGTNYTLSAWLKTSTPGAAYFYKGDLGWNGNDQLFYLNAAGTGTHPGGVQFAGGFLTGNANVADGNWHLVTIDRSNGTATIYVDGVVDVSNQGAMGNAEQGTQHVRIGWTPGNDGSVPFNGLISGVSVFDTALTQSQVQTLFAGQTLNGVLPAASPVQIATAGTLDLNGFSQGVASLADSGGGAGGTLTNSGTTNATISLLPPDGSVTSFSGVIKDGVGKTAVVVNASGPTASGGQIFTGANTYTGGTLIQAGRLLANSTDATNGSTGPGAVTVGDKTNANAFHGTLAGTGNIVGPVSVFNGSTISAGDGIGTTGKLSLLSASGNTLGAGSNYLWKINDAGNAQTGTGTGPGTAGNAVGWDQIVFNSLSSSANAVDVIVTGTGTGGKVASFNPNSAYQWAIAKVPGNGNALAADFHLDTPALSTFASNNPGAGSGGFSIGSDANDIYVVYSPAPEPTSLMLLGLGAGGLLLRRRRSNAV